MTTGGMIVRLIDVVLILLFGFISISEITEKSDVNLAESSKMEPSQPEDELVVIVAIVKNGDFLVENESKRLGSPQQLLQYLAEAKTKYKSSRNLRISIRPAWDTPIKRTMYVAAICDRLNISKGIAVRRIKAEEKGS